MQIFAVVVIYLCFEYYSRMVLLIPHQLCDSGNGWDPKNRHKIVSRFCVFSCLNSSWVQKAPAQRIPNTAMKSHSYSWEYARYRYFPLRVYGSYGRSYSMTYDPLYFTTGTLCMVLVAIMYYKWFLFYVISLTVYFSFIRSYSTYTGFLWLIVYNHTSRNPSI